MSPRGLWIVWGAVALAGATYLGAAMIQGEKTVFLPGATTAGHYQIEADCAACHTPFGGVREAACLGCHQEELAAIDDAHPKSKFTDPRNADRVALLDARSCITCHKEHNPAITQPMGVTLPEDFCFMCHSDIGEDRPSHVGLEFRTCATAGCHNYHDNTALYEDFLLSHAGEPALLPTPRVPRRALLHRLKSIGPAHDGPLTRTEQDWRGDIPVDATALAEWESTSHAAGGVNCSGCHVRADSLGGEHTWVRRPAESECAACHDPEVEGFLAGRHGMRVARGLPPMRPELARLPMKPEAAELQVSCSSCHSSHRFDTRTAAVDGCLSCHDDLHSLAYVSSPHYALWLAEGSSPERGSGVSCATCHLPREQQRTGGVDAVFVRHNQNQNLRPNERMGRQVCLNCHGLEFTLDALADTQLIQANFKGRPTQRVTSVEMAVERRARP